MDILRALETRRSVRSYKKDKVDAALLHALLDIGRGAESLLSDIHIRFVLYEDGSEIHKELSGQVGYLGHIIDAPHYVVCLSEDKEGFLENAGFTMEQLMLQAALIGLGTCWISILKNEDKIKQLLRIEGNERVVALTPVGFAKTSMVEKFFNEVLYREIQPRAVKKEINEIFYLNHWNQSFLPEELPHPALYNILDFSRQAPSWGNRQPYRLVISKRGIMMAVEKEKEYFADHELNHNRLDAGIIMLYLYLLGRNEGLNWHWSMDPALVQQREYHIPETHEYLGFLTFKV